MVQDSYNGKLTGNQA